MKTMTRIFLSIMLAAFLTVNIGAQPIEKEASLEQGKDGFVYALKSDNNGVRNSALLLVLKMNTRFPNEDMNLIEKQLKKMSINDPSLVVRTNANMALSYIQNPGLSRVINPCEYESPTEFFDNLYVKIAENQVALQ